MLLLFSQQIEINPNNATHTKNAYIFAYTVAAAAAVATLSILGSHLFEWKTITKPYQLPYRPLRLYNRTQYTDTFVAAAAAEWMPPSAPIAY